MSDDSLQPGLQPQTENAASDQGDEHEGFAPAGDPFGESRTNGPHTDRDESGRFVAGNQAALTHGGSRVVLGALTPAEAARAHEVRQGVLADLGGPENVSAARLALVDRLCEAIVLAEVTWSHIAAVGPVTTKGRRRAATDLYLAASGRVERLASAVGLERRQKQARSLQEAIMAAPVLGRSRED